MRTRRSFHPLLALLALLAILAVLTLGLLPACETLNHHLIHPVDVPAGVITWSEDVETGDLLVHLEWAAPRGEGPFPAVLVHAEGGKTAQEMKGVIWDLAQRGYVAAAADYKRRIDGTFRRNMFAWRSEADVTASLGLIRARPSVDKDRIATLGFSQGGIFALLIAAHAPGTVKAVVSYYPVADFEEWLSAERPNPVRRLVYRIIRSFFRRESGARDEEEFRRMLKAASPLPNAEKIKAPVLLVHGEMDTTASPDESRRLAARFRELGRDVELLIVPGAAHVFNFKQTEQARRAWDATIRFLENHIGPSPPKNP
ncbi:MAG: dienelactone hydrolase family protein [Nitrospirae bacterium]|nr:dienelactone hydrolase family protein [Nitrospirota bacterium]